ncbi:hypothetical protein B0T20DRAFT_392547 [Sordaria brevicollis]|uniref:Uncharacterized protein n=1 Tax=Sordaria brevicollis TaxID=83679 RepID=A0AAE0UCV2_SORBR|nr:hypothetical protein B0T20DRAFT_392547 [Sordaria brevicollis]
MPLQLSELVLSTFSNGLKVLVHLIDVAEEHAYYLGLSADDLYPDARLIEDMKPFSFQIQEATTAVNIALARLGVTELQAWADEESTMAELRARIAKAQKLLEEVDKEDIDKGADEAAYLHFGPMTLTTTGKGSILGYSIPNFFFHIQTAYAILRSKGVPLGKKDYAESFVLPYLVV